MSLWLYQVTTRFLVVFLQLITPANTPATPPNFPDALNMFSNLSTSDRMATSPLATSSLSPRSNQQTRNSFSPMMSPPPPQFNHQTTSTGFIQTTNQQPWRGHGNPPNTSSGFGPPQMGPPPPPLQQQTICDQSQVYSLWTPKWMGVCMSPKDWQSAKMWHM